MREKLWRAGHSNTTIKDYSPLFGIFKAWLQIQILWQITWNFSETEKKFKCTYFRVRHKKIYS